MNQVDSTQRATRGPQSNNSQADDFAKTPSRQDAKFVALELLSLAVLLTLSAVYLWGMTWLANSLGAIELRGSLVLIGYLAIGLLLAGVVLAIWWPINKALGAASPSSQLDQTK
ncbi:MAG: hypothetical protein AAF586_02840 [Planctomycetota bacterium]